MHMHTHTHTNTLAGTLESSGFPSEWWWSLTQRWYALTSEDQGQLRGGRPCLTSLAAFDAWGQRSCHGRPQLPGSYLRYGIN